MSNRTRRETLCERSTASLLQIETFFLLGVYPGNTVVEMLEMVSFSPAYIYIYTIKVETIQSNSYQS